MFPDTIIIRYATTDARAFFAEFPAATPEECQETAFQMYNRLEPQEEREPRSVQLERYRTVFAMEWVRLQEIAETANQRDHFRFGKQERIDKALAALNQECEIKLPAETWRHIAEGDV